MNSESPKKVAGSSQNSMQPLTDCTPFRALQRKQRTAESMSSVVMKIVDTRNSSRTRTPEIERPENVQQVSGMICGHG